MNHLAPMLARLLLRGTFWQDIRALPSFSRVAATAVAETAFAKSAAQKDLLLGKTKPMFRLAVQA